MWVTQPNYRMLDADEDYIVYRPRKKRHKYYFGPSGGMRRTTTLLLICVFVFIFSVVKLSSYIVDYFGSRSMSAAMRNTYHDEQYSTAAFPLPSSTPSSTAVFSPTSVPASSPSPSPTATPQTKLEEIPYPNNPYRIISTHFAKIRRQNKDIIGWLTVDGLIDEAVVQRDNEYYLDRDFRGYHNVNGALFLEQTCDLSTRPYTYQIYGHNMKSGLMFGSLRNYEDITFYRNNPFITFDTIYENGRYVIFAVATVSLDPAHWRYVNLTKLHSSIISYRQKEITTLIRRSKYNCKIDVQPQDQLLLLITCVDDETDRRVIAARRIRVNETEEDLHRLVKQTKIR